jgi:hypothetical protein
MVGSFRRHIQANITVSVMKAVWNVCNVRCSEKGRLPCIVDRVLFAVPGRVPLTILESLALSILLPLAFAWLLSCTFDMPFSFDAPLRIGLVLATSFSDCVGVEVFWPSSHARSSRRLARDHHTGPRKLVKRTCRATTRTRGVSIPLKPYVRS